MFTSSGRFLTPQLLFEKGVQAAAEGEGETRRARAEMRHVLCLNASNRSREDLSGQLRALDNEQAQVRLRRDRLGTE